MIAGAEVLAERCADCDTRLVITYDALQRPRKRCPKCQGVSHVKPHPDEVLVPVTLQRLTASALPPVAPGQLRCQVCAKGLEGRGRFHPECQAARQRERRRRRCACGAMFVPRGGAKQCADCREHGRKPKPRLCTGCNRLSDAPFGRRVVTSCAWCRTPRKSSPRLCLNCGAEWPRYGGRQTTSHCAKCPPKTRTCSGFGRVTPLRGSATVVASCAACRQAVRSPRSTPTARPRFAEKPCANCTRPFVPTGPRAKYCEACR